MAQTYLKDIHGAQLTEVLARVLQLTRETHQGVPVYINQDGLSQGPVDLWGIHNNDVIVQLIQEHHIALVFNDKVGWTAKLHRRGYLASSPLLEEAVAYAVIGGLHGVMLESDLLESA